MGHAITVDMPQEVYEALAKTARQTGQTPEELAARWLAAVVRQSASDPLERFIGGIPTNIPDSGRPTRSVYRQNTQRRDVGLRLRGRINA